MSTNKVNSPLISREMIEASMQRARVERSNAMWNILSRLFSRPEHRADEGDVHHAAKTGFRLG
jgi:hypothetical protein